jgi:hypothetical protein
MSLNLDAALFLLGISSTPPPNLYTCGSLKSRRRTKVLFESPEKLLNAPLCFISV